MCALGRLRSSSGPHNCAQATQCKALQNSSNFLVVPCCSIKGWKQHAALACLTSWAGSPRHARVLQAAAA